LAYERRGAANYNLKQYDKTINDYQTVIRLFPTHPISKTVLIPLQEALNVAGRSGEFETNLSQYKNANPDDESVEKLEFETAKNLYFDQQYQKSITSFTSYLASYPRSAAAQEAKFYIAEAHYKLQDYNKALPFYTELNNDMTFSMGSRVVARLAEIHFKQGSYDKAVVNYHRLEKLATNKKEQYNAWAGLMESFYLQAQYDSVDVYARTIIERGNINAGAQNKASLYLGKTALARGDFEGAKDEFLNTLNAARDEFGAEAKYLLAEILYNQKEHKQCYETLMGLINDFSTYEVWVGKAFLLLADNFAAQNDVFQARATLQSLDKFPLQSIKDQAKAKLKQLEQSELDKQKKIEADTLDN
jgi:TolA-binding protein